MQYGANEAIHITHCHTNSDVANLSYRRIGQHTTEVVLSHSHNGANQDTGDTQDT